MKLELKIRRLVIQIDEIHLEMQKNVDPPARKALAAGVFHNPYAGRYVENPVSYTHLTLPTMIGV